MLCCGKIARRDEFTQWNATHSLCCVCDNVSTTTYSETSSVDEPTNSSRECIKSPFDGGDIVTFLAILFASHLANVSLESNTKLEKELVHDCLAMKMVNFLSGNEYTFHPITTHVSLVSF